MPAMYWSWKSESELGANGGVVDSSDNEKVKVKLKPMVGSSILHFCLLLMAFVSSTWSGQHSETTKGENFLVKIHLKFIWHKSRYFPLSLVLQKTLRSTHLTSRFSIMLIICFSKSQTSIPDQIFTWSRSNLLSEGNMTK